MEMNRRELLGVLGGAVATGVLATTAKTASAASTADEGHAVQSAGGPIIDFRFRPNTPEILKNFSTSKMFKYACQYIGFDKRKPQSMPEIVADLDARGVPLCVITGRDCETTYGSSNNKEVLSFIQAYPKRFIGYWGVDPHKGMEAAHALRKAVIEHKMRGASIDPYLAHMKPDDARFYPIYAYCCDLNIPVVITTAPPIGVQGALVDYCDPRYVDTVARDFPDLTIILSHGGYPFVSEAIFACLHNINVYMEISEYERSPMADVYMKAMNTMIPDKVLFASAHPFIEQKDAIEAYLQMPLKAEVRRKVLYENAKRLIDKFAR